MAVLKLVGILQKSVVAAGYAAEIGSCSWIEAIQMLLKSVVAAGLKLGMVFHQHDVVAAGVGRGSAT